MISRFHDTNDNNATTNFDDKNGNDDNHDNEYNPRNENNHDNGESYKHGNDNNSRLFKNKNQLIPLPIPDIKKKLIRTPSPSPILKPNSRNKFDIGDYSSRFAKFDLDYQSGNQQNSKKSLVNTSKEDFQPLSKREMSNLRINGELVLSARLDKKGDAHHKSKFFDEDVLNKDDEKTHGIKNRKNHGDHLNNIGDNSHANDAKSNFKKLKPSATAKTIRDSRGLQEGISYFQDLTAQEFDILQHMKIKALKKSNVPPEIGTIMVEYEKLREIPIEERLKFLRIVRIADIDYVRRYQDNFPLLGLRKAIWMMFKYSQYNIKYSNTYLLLLLFTRILSKICLKIIKSSYFENLTLVIIIWNSIILSFYDPVNETTAYPDYFDNIFLIYYTIEMILKIIGLGFIFTEDAYLKETWNIMDFVIVITAYIPIVFGSGGVNLRGLRSLRVLRPLRTISTVKSLRVIVSTVLQTLPYMRDIIFISFFTLFIFSIIGLQLFMGSTKNRCMDINTGMPIYNPNYPEINYQQYCGSLRCSPDLGLAGMNIACAKMMSDPFYGITNFGTISWALLNVYQTITQEGWSYIMIILEMTWNPLAPLYFIPCTFIGAYYFLNLVMAVITTIFTINSKKDTEALKEKHKATREENVMRLLNKHKVKIVDVINNYQKGTLNYSNIQFIRGKLYYYDPKNSKNKKQFRAILKNYWNKFLIFIIGERINTLLKRNEAQELNMIKGDLKLDPLSITSNDKQITDKSKNTSQKGLLDDNSASIDNSHSMLDKTKKKSQNYSLSHESLNSHTNEFDTSQNALVEDPIIIYANAKGKSPQLFKYEHLKEENNQQDTNSKNQKSSKRILTRISMRSYYEKNINNNPIFARKSSTGSQLTSSLRNELLPISIINREGFQMKNTKFKIQAALDHKLPSKKLGNIQVKPLGIMSPMKVLHKRFADIIEEDENEDGFMIDFKNGRENVLRSSMKKVQKKNSLGQEKDQNTSFVISSDEISTDKEDDNVATTINNEKALLDENLTKKVSEKGMLNYDRSKSKSTLQNKDSHISNISGVNQLSKKYSHMNSNTSINKLRNHDGSFMLKKTHSYLEDYQQQFQGITDQSELLKLYENQQEELIQEYLEDDLNDLELDKDRIIVQIKSLKIDIYKGEINSKINSLDEVAPLYWDREYKRREENDMKKRLKIKLNPIYHLGEPNEQENLIHLMKKQNRRIFDIPIIDNQNRRQLYNKNLRNYKKARIYPQNNYSLKTETPHYLIEKPFELLQPIFTEITPNSTFHKSKTKRMLSIKTHHFNQPIIEPDVEMAYDGVFKKVAEDLQIDKYDILDEQSIEFFTLDKEYNEIKQDDLVEKKIKSRNWSGHEILILSYYIQRINKIKKSLMQKYESIWEKGYFGLVQSTRRRIRKFCDGPIFSNFLLLVVLVNTVFLAGVGIITSDDSTGTNSWLDQVNQGFTIIFIIEMSLKLVGIGPINYIRDPMNLIDGMVVILSIVELVVASGAHAFSAFRTIRIFRATRVLRMTKLLRALAFMRFLISVLAKAFKDFMSVLFLMAIFLYIYTLLGMQLLGGNFTYPDNVGWNSVRNNFDTLPQALISVYQLMTVENWNNIMYFAERSTAGYYLPILYMVSWIVIGNYILLNLLMALLLSQFGGDEVEEEEDNDNNSDDDMIIDDINLENSEGDIIATSSTVPNPKFHFILTHPKLLTKPLSKNQEIKKDNAPENPTFIFDDNDDIDANSGKVIMFHENECKRSIYIFKKTWRIRRTIYWFVKQNWFDYVVLIVISLSSLKLAVDSYIDSSDESMSTLSNISNNIDIGITIFFVLESVLKVIALGFILDKGCYLRDSWNILDFIIVASGLIDLSLSTVNLPFLKVLRVLRTLRPLRLVTHNKNMRLIVTALLESVGGIVNVGIVVIMIILIFAILGVNLMRNKLGICDVSTNPNLSRYGINYDTCLWLGYNWKVWDINFDNVFQGMLSLFVLTTQEGWPDYMFRCTDANDADTGPIENNFLIIFAYFAIFLLIGAYFMINLFVGVILYEYGQAEKREKKKYSFLTDEQEKWIEIQKMLLKLKPDIILSPKYAYQQMWLFIVEMNIFEVLIMMCIIANMITMGLNYDEALPSYNVQLKTINYVFTGIFIFEMYAKLSAYGIKVYFMNNWNKFDCFVVGTSILDIVFDNLQGTSLSILKIGPQLGRIFRIMRVTRLVRLIKQFPSVQKLVTTLIYSLPYMMNVFALVLLVFFIYSIMATYLFNDISGGENISHYINFSNFSQSISTLFICSTGENWYITMFDTVHPTSCTEGGSNCGPGAAIALIFWISFIVIVQYIVLNLFVMVILDLFSELMINENNPLNHFTENAENFKKVWREYSRNNQGLYIHRKNIIQFFLNLEDPLGFKKTANIEDDGQNNIKKVATEIMRMNIRMDDQNNITFHEILFAALKKAHGPKGDSKREGKEAVRKVEEKTLAKISNVNNSFTLKRAFTNGFIKQNKIVVNPLFQLLFVGMSFSAWKNYSERVIQYHIENGSSAEYCTPSSEEVIEDTGDSLKEVDNPNQIENNDGITPIGIDEDEEINEDRELKDKEDIFVEDVEGLDDLKSQVKIPDGESKEKFIKDEEKGMDINCYEHEGMIIRLASPIKKRQHANAFDFIERGRGEGNSVNKSYDELNISKDDKN